MYMLVCMRVSEEKKLCILYYYCYIVVKYASLFQICIYVSMYVCIGRKKSLPTKIHIYVGLWRKK